jgi:hypothetical protein
MRGEELELTNGGTKWEGRVRDNSTLELRTGDGRRITARRISG